MDGSVFEPTSPSFSPVNRHDSYVFSMGSAIPTMTPPARLLSEAARERETLKYDSLRSETARIAPGLDLSAAAEPALAAFAQLGLYRLNAGQAIISLFDRSHQHIIADALRPLPLPLDGRELPKSLCGVSVAREVSICDHVVSGPVRKSAAPGEQSQSPTDLPTYVVSDLKAHPVFHTRGDPYWNFYAAVPIRTREDINIGVYCVFDAEPRPAGLTAEQDRFLQDISHTVMDYLEFKRSDESWKRESRMVHGLGSFVEGKATLSTPPQRCSRRSRSYIPKVCEGAFNIALQTLHVEDADSKEHAGVDGKARTQEGEKKAPGDASDDPTPRRPRLATTPEAEERSARAGPRDDLKDDIDHVFSKAANIIRESIQVDGVLVLDATVHSFGGLVGGVTDPAIPESHGFMNDGIHSDDNIPDPISSAEGLYCNVLGFSTSLTSSIKGDEPPLDYTSVPETYLQTLLQKYPQGRLIHFDQDGTLLHHAGSEADDTPPSSPGTRRTERANSDDWRTDDDIPRGSYWSRNVASSLTKIFPGARCVAVVPLWDQQRNRCFAGGFVWTKSPARVFTVENELNYFRVFGLASMSEVSRLKARAAVKTETAILGSISHELRSPLHGVVGAVELLRDTPLDGFQEGIVNTIETSGRTLLDTIDHLLDYSQTTNMMRTSIADIKGNGAGPRARAGSTPSLTRSVPELPVQLDLLVEEVVESVMAGHAFRAMSDSHFATLDSSLPTSASGSTSNPTSTSASRRRENSWRSTAEFQRNERWCFSPKAVQVYLNIDPSANWAFRTNPGAFRRIVMNLFGNSLKFTSAGSITITLRHETAQQRRVREELLYQQYLHEHHLYLPHHPRHRLLGRQRPPLPAQNRSDDSDVGDRVILTVSDTGRGIGESYLRDHLFTPFSQEDNFSPGTGLGLSLVRQMTAVLGGTIDVSSRVGKGTTVTVSLPLARDNGGVDDEDHQSAAFRAAVRALKGRKVLLRGLGAPDGRMSQLQLLESVCRDWLLMETISGNCIGEDMTPQFVICGEEDLHRVYSDAGTRTDADARERPDPTACPHIFICQNSAVERDLSKPSQARLRKSFVFLAPPIGPRKLARALLNSEDLWKGSQLSSAPAGSASTGSDHTSEEAAGGRAPISSLQQQNAFKDSEGSQVTECIHDSKPKEDATSRPILGPVVVELAIPTRNSGSAPPPLAKDEQQQKKETPDGTATNAAIQPIQRSLSMPTAPAADARASILIVDDNAINLKILAAYMSKLKHPHTSATNGLEAVERYMESPQKYSCILTDISMPVMDGLESTRRIRAFESSRRLRPAVVIALTGLGGADVRHDAFASGVDLLLTRPLVLKGLVGALETMGLR